jgi:type IV secretion system protein VirB5
MKKVLLAGVAAAALIFTAPARAQIPVIDVTAIADLLKQIGVSTEQLTELIALYNETVQVYDTAVHIWNDVEGLVGADTWAPGLLAGNIRNPLPFVASASAGWVGGFNDPSTLPFGSQYLTQNTVGGNPLIYEDRTFVGNELLKAVRSLASMQAVASNHLSAIETRISALNDLFTRLASIKNIQQTDSLSARLHSELNYAHSQQVQAQQVMGAAQLQMQVLEYNQRQWMYQDETTGIKAACGSASKAASFVTIPACLSASSTGQ